MIEQESNFLEQQIAEVEAKEHQQLYGLYNLICMEINRLQNEIEATFIQADIEKKHIDEWALSHNVKQQERVTYLKSKFETFVHIVVKKTLDLLCAVLKLYKNQIN